MGRRRAVAAVASGGVDSSPSSAESSFRELDDVFLQTQTRIWLGEVLKTRLDEQLHISDLLADGELLFEVSKLVWDMLLAKCTELRHVKAYQCLLGSRKSGGRYMPYSNVDTFLKTCTILGLNGIDLFSPSDAVEKRDIRKVCICIRALSKKARSKQLNVPDFDVVSYTVSMPTEMVGCIRKSLESSQCSFASSSSCSSRKITRSKHQQETSISECDGNYDSSSDVSDEAESKYLELEYFCSSPNKFDDPATLSSHAEDSCDAFSAIKQYTTRKNLQQSDTKNLYTINLEKGEPIASTLLQSMNSLPTSQSANEHHADKLSSCHIKSQLHLHSIHSHVNTDQANNIGILRNEASSSGNSLFDSVPERDFISDYLAFSDSVVLETNGSSPVFFDREDSICNFFLGFDSHQSATSQRRFQNGFHPKSSDDMEDVEVSSCTSMSSILGRVLHMDFDDQFDAGDSSIVKVHSCGLLEQEADRLGRGSFMEDQPLDVAQPEHVGFCHEFLSTSKDQGKPSAMESSKIDKHGSFQKHLGDTFSLKGANLAYSENLEELSLCPIVEKAVIADAISISYSESIQGGNHTPVSSPRYQTSGESSLRRNKFSVGGTENCCNLQYQPIEIIDITGERSQKTSDGIDANQDFISLANECDIMAEQQRSFFGKSSKHINDAGQHEYTNCHEKDGRMHGNSEVLSESDLGWGKDRNGELQKGKPRGRPLLKTVVRGTALVGAVFLLLHISKRNRGKTDEPSKHLNQTRVSNGPKSSSNKEQSRRSDRSYPTEKLNFAK